jgi:DNA ligase 1
VTLLEVAEVSAAVAESSSRLRKVQLLASLLRRAAPGEASIVIPFLSGFCRQERLNAGYAAVAAAAAVPSAASPSLQLGDVDAQFSRIAEASGPGSANARAALLADLFQRAVGVEQDFLARLIHGELRQGALEGVLTDAVAQAATIAPARIRRAAMLAGSLAAVAEAVLTDGAAALDRFAIQPFRPLQPMLADSADHVDAALNELGREAALEYKIDGARIQVHKVENDIRVYSRNLRDVTIAVPEVVEAVRALPAATLVLDGEAVVLRRDGSPEPFQVTMRRFGRRQDVERLRTELPVTPLFFDALYVDGTPLVDEPLAHRVSVLSDRVGAANRVPRIVTADAGAAREFVEQSLAAGHEGVMAKAVDAAYQAGRRGSAWLKVKRARTLDLVVLAAEWGSGRRRGTLSNLHLGARDENGSFVMLGKTFKGLTDQMLAWQTERFLQIEIGREGHIVHVRPELVVEVAFNEIQGSPQYPGGVALRFARVKRYRPDKTAAEADTIATVQAMYRATNRVDA